jgi:bla regulator protein blaR1
MIPESLSPLANHLWQSTLFACAAWLLTLALRKSPARVRHWVWVVASVKFLIPFSVLIAIGGHIGWRTAPAIAPNVSVVMGQVSQPFTATTVSSPMLATVPTGPNPLAAILFGIWACGFIGISISWWIRWRRITAAVRAGSALQLRLPIRAVSSPSFLEPGIFGVFQQVLLLPEGIFEHLTPEQWKAVVAHELCHVRRRDNLIGLMQMFVETVFWFHPLTWWIGKRIFEERERACDEEVVKLGNEPSVYARGILKVCELYLESPLECVAGVSGSNLRKRIEGIMGNRVVMKLNGGKTVLLAAAGMLAVVVPIIVGVMNAPVVRAQAQPPAVNPSFEVASIRVIPNVDVSKALPANFSLTPRRSGGRISWTTDLIFLSCYAYHLPGWRIQGTDKDQHFYAIEATIDASASEDQVRLMFQELLADRFKLAIHHETKEVQGYALAVAKNGLRVKAATAGEAHPMPPYFPYRNPGALEGQVLVTAAGPGILALTGRGVSMPQLAETLSDKLGLGTFVLDQTGAGGKYYFGFQFQHVDRPNEDVDVPSIFTALQDELGLKLEKQKGPVEVLVIDHVERPSEN